MGSATGSKWLTILILYFISMLFILTLVGSAASGDEENVDTGEFSELCSPPRNIYEADEYGVAGNTEDTPKYRSRPYRGHIDCQKSFGTQSESECNNIPGCEWNTTGYLWWSGDSCVGVMDLPGLTNDTVALNNDVIRTHDNQNPESACTHPSVIQNETRCELLSCSWMTKEEYDRLNPDNQNIIRTGYNMWDTVRDLVTLQYDFGIEDENSEKLVNLIVFFVPMMMILLSLYMIARAYT